MRTGKLNRNVQTSKQDKHITKFQLCFDRKDKNCFPITLKQCVPDNSK